MERTVIDLEKTSTCRLQSPILDDIREHFSVENKIANFKHLQKRYRFIPKRKYIITPTGRFDIGVYGQIAKYLTLNGYDVLATDNVLKEYNPKYDIQKIEELKIPLRDYQKETIIKCYKQGRGISVIATAGGKTLIMASLIHNIMLNKLAKKVLVITPTLQLVEQTYSDFITYGINTQISKWTGTNELKPECNIIIAGLSILQNKNTDLSILSTFDLILFDECHNIRRDNQYNNLFKHFHTPHRFGFTGTMPEDKLDQWNVIGKIGPILYQKTSYELRKDHYISPVQVQILFLKYKTRPVYSEKNINQPTLQYIEENNFLYNNSYRNEIIKILCSKLHNNTLLLVDRLEHGELLTKLLSTINKKVYFIRGSVEVDDREQIRQLMESSNDILCVAISKIFSTGINIKNLHYIIFALIGKAEQKLIQSIGRGLRLHESKHELIIFDIADNTKYSYKHLKKRLQIYENEKIPYKTRKIEE